jgi:hypothetical protein
MFWRPQERLLPILSSLTLHFYHRMWILQHRCTGSGTNWYIQLPGSVPAHANHVYLRDQTHTQLMLAGGMPRSSLTIQTILISTRVISVSSNCPGHAIVTDKDWWRGTKFNGAGAAHSIEVILCPSAKCACQPEPNPPHIGSPCLLVVVARIVRPSSWPRIGGAMERHGGKNCCDLINSRGGRRLY